MTKSLNSKPGTEGNYLDILKVMKLDPHITPCIKKSAPNASKTKINGVKL